MHEVTIFKPDDSPLSVVFNFTPEVRATRLDPAEPAEIEIVAVGLGGAGVSDEWIEEKLWSCEGIEWEAK